MNVGLLGEISWWAQTLAWIFIVVCVLLIIIVLLQKGRGGGLSAAFGGAGGQSAFGSKTGDVFTWITIVVVGLFLIMAVFLSKYYVPRNPDQQYAPDTIQSPAGTTPATTAPADNSQLPGEDQGPESENTQNLPPVDTENNTTDTDPEEEK